MNTAHIRESFLKFFKEREHMVVPSSSLVPHKDPSLLFTNSGMVQFKNYFTGLEKPAYRCATSAQKCLRAGGKHNDLENVGYTARHHTFFEMMGNFSFGDYFKEEAIHFAWELLHKTMGISQDKLYVTVFSEDEEAATLWKKIANFPDSKILRIPTTDNFWSMGDTGPCGPCTEIFYDHGDAIWGGLPGTKDQDGDRFVEIWNLVFMQFEQLSDGSRISLPKPSVDTGMGLERMAAVMQGVANNYDTDILKALVLAAADLTKTKPEEPYLVSQRVIADHMRAMSFLIAEGVLPSNEGRGYVLRRIMRRAMRHVHLLGTIRPTLYKLVSVLVEKMGNAYPELIRTQELIEGTIHHEEERFSETLGRGMKILEEEFRNHQGAKVFSGDVAFKLYDTYGFPVDLTQDILKGQGIQVDVSQFERALKAQKEKARASWKGSGDQKAGALWFEVREEVGPSEFLGYQTDAAEGHILKILKEGKPLEKGKVGDKVQVVCNQTPFYGESGGQSGDSGFILGSKGRGAILDTQKQAENLIVHEVEITEGTLSAGDAVELKVNSELRQKLRANHSATHLLGAALQRHLGASVLQKGSLVAPHRLRFDFSHTQAVSKNILRQIEAEVNQWIRSNAPVATILTTPEEALNEGAQGLFGEKYGAEVRVVSMGPYSKELCGGTHVQRTGEIGLFKILTESSVASGVRRIEAVTGLEAEAHVAELEETLQQAADLLKTNSKGVPARLTQWMEERKKGTPKNSISLDLSVEEINGVKFGSQVLDNVPPQDLKELMDQGKAKQGSGIVVIFSSFEGKVSALVGVTSDLMGTHDARDLIKPLADALGGKGGGRSDLAQCGGTDESKIPEAIEALRNKLSPL
jgi:alanyl-tRNA synthetase